MPQAYYPNANDLQMFLVGAFGGNPLFSFDPTRYRLDIAAGAGVSTFERRVHRRMLAPLADETRSFNPPITANGILDLGQDGGGGDMVSVTSVISQPVGQPPEPFVYGLVSPLGYVLNGPPKVSGSPAVPLGPPYVPERELPFYSIRFFCRWAFPLYPSIQQSLQVTGRWGFGATLPDDVWEAMLMLAALYLFEQIRLGLLGFLTEWTEAAVTERYDPRLLLQLRQGWEMGADAVVALYRRYSV